MGFPVAGPAGKPTRMHWPVMLAFVVAGCSSTANNAAFDAQPWRIVVGRADVSLRGVCVVDDRVAWASGSHGTVLRSVDGGAQWQMVGPRDGEALDFRDVEAFDAERALVSSTTSPARVYATENGGATWRIVFESMRPAAFFDAMAFGESGHGVLFADPIDGVLQIANTTDGGATWRVLSDSPPAAVAGEGGFAASGTCVRALAQDVWIVTGGLRSRCLHSSDAGITWQGSELPIAAGKASSGAFSVAFFDRDHGVVVGGDYEDQAATAGTAAWTRDGGRNWQLAAGTGAGGYRSGVVGLADGRTCIAVGQGGASRSRDRGATWQPLGSDGFHAVAAAGNRVIAVGTAGRIGTLVRGAR